MKIMGIISEYNPFHNGHKFQLELAREKSDAVIIIMSGNFVQRGTIAITDKWTRAEMALKNGADLVVELPLIYAMSTAQKFAKGAVSLLDKTGVVDGLCFGSECGDVNELTNTAKALIDEPKEVSEKIKEYTARGMTFAAAREKAFRGYIKEGILSEPNNILGVEYIKSLIELNSDIIPYTHTRKGTQYHDDFTDKDIASASAIRKMINENTEINRYMPEANFKIYDESILDTAVISFLRSIDTNELAKINDVGEGLENRIKKAAGESFTIEELCNKIKTKRYPMSRIRRIVFSAFLGITKEVSDMESNYLRVLGMNETGTEILRRIKEKSSLKIITKTADYKEDDIVFQKDILATDIFALCGNEKSGMDFLKSPVIIK